MYRTHLIELTKSAGLVQSLPSGLSEQKFILESKNHLSRKGISFLFVSNIRIVEAHLSAINVFLLSSMSIPVLSMLFFVIKFLCRVFFSFT